MTQEQQLEKKRTEYLISGYINELSQNLESIITPIEIADICLQFYRLHDYFTIHGDKIIVNKSRNIAIGTSINKTVSHTVYGNEIIDLDDKTIQKYIWYLHIYEIQCLKGFYIGICNINHLKPNRANLTYRWNSITFNNFQPPFVRNVHGCIVTLSLETKKKWIWNKQKRAKELVDKHILCMNGGDHPQYRKEVKREKGTKYCLGITLSDIKQRVDIIKFQVTNYPNYDEMSGLQSVTEYIKTLWDFHIF